MKKIVLKSFDIVKTIFFSFFLYPITSGSFGINYAFILYPICSSIRSKEFLIPQKEIIHTILAFILILISGLIVNPVYDSGKFLRVLISFFLFMSIFSFVFIEINEKLIALFKYSLLFMSSFLSSWAFLKFFYYGGNVAGYAMKDIVGSQRYGFIYLMGFFILFHLEIKSKLHNMMKFSGLLLISIGIMLTFSRASVVSFIITLFVFSMVNITKIRKITSKDLLKFIPTILIVSASLFIIYKIFQLPFDFFIDRILDRYFRGNIVITPETSEGIRFKIWKAILDHTLINPFTGSTYLGTWILEGLQAGSAHNQYMDLLFRVGIIGFFLYIYLIFKTALFLYNGDKGLFWGTLSILIYGLFHETFKEPNGAFILSFLVGMYSTHIRCYAPSASTSKKIEPKNQDNSKIVTENLAA